MAVRVLTGDCREVMRGMDAESVDCIVTSPPYWGLRDYGTASWQGGDAGCAHVERYARHDAGRTQVNGFHGSAEPYTAGGVQFRANCSKCGAIRVDRQLGLEASLGEHIATMVLVFREARRVLKKQGTVWINYGSCYAAAANGRSAADTKANGKDDRTFRDKPFSTVSPGKRSSQPRIDVPAYDSDDRAQPDWRDPGSACSDPDDEPQDGFLSHRDRTSHNGEPSEPDALRLSRTDRDSEHPDSVAAFVDASPRDAPPSNTRASFRRDRAVCVPQAMASASPSLLPSADDGPLFADKAVCTDGSVPLASASRIQGKDALGLACQCGSCGVCWTNLAIKSLPFKAKDLITVPNILALALQADGWWVRSEIIWAKPNPMPESVRDRPTSAHEKIWLLARSERYFYDAEAIREEAEYGRRDWNGQHYKGTILERHSGKTTGGDPDAGRNRRNVWTIPSQPFSDAHFATFPPALIEPCILAGCPKGGIVLDPFGGAGTTGLVADRLGRNAILIELNPTYAAMAMNRVADDLPLFAEVRPS